MKTAEGELKWFQVTRRTDLDLRAAGFGVNGKVGGKQNLDNNNRKVIWGRSIRAGKVQLRLLLRQRTVKTWGANVPQSEK